MNGLKEMLLTAPDSQLDACMFPLIEKWDAEPRAIQILEVLDQCIYSALASGVVITVLQTMLNEQIRKENTTLDELVKSAVWRESHG